MKHDFRIFDTGNEVNTCTPLPLGINVLRVLICSVLSKTFLVTKLHLWLINYKVKTQNTWSTNLIIAKPLKLHYGNLGLIRL